MKNTSFYLVLNKVYSSKECICFCRKMIEFHFCISIKLGDNFDFRTLCSSVKNLLNLSFEPSEEIVCCSVFFKYTKLEYNIQYGKNK